VMFGSLPQIDNCFSFFLYFFDKGMNWSLQINIPTENSLWHPLITSNVGCLLKN
jgi:hypothetical protein